MRRAIPATGLSSGAGEGRPSPQPGRASGRDSDVRTAGVRPIPPHAEPDNRHLGGFTALLQDVIAMAIPGKLDVTLKINQLPQAKPAL